MQHKFKYYFRKDLNNTPENREYKFEILNIEQIEAWGVINTAQGHIQDMFKDEGFILIDRCPLVHVTKDGKEIYEKDLIDVKGEGFHYSVIVRQSGRITRDINSYIPLYLNSNEFEVVSIWGNIYNDSDKSWD